jgi:UMF1 family MFS transporter
MATSSPNPKRWFTREVFGWAMFDFANQAFTLVILTTMYQLYFINHIVVNNAPLGWRLWATSNIIGQVVVIVSSPVIGALADFSGAKKKLLFTMYIVAVVMTASLGILRPGDVALAMFLFTFGYIFYAVGENFMSSFLPEIARHEQMGRVSGFGWSMGYTGGLVCLGGATIIASLTSSEVAAYRLICLWAGVFFMLAGIPTFIFVRERKLREAMPEGRTIWTIGFVRLASTFRELRRYRQLFRFLPIMTFYLAGMQIFVFFSGTIIREVFKFGTQKMALSILVITVTSIVGAVGTILYQDRIGAKRTIMICLAVWMVAMFAAGFVNAEREYLFWILGSIVGVNMGVLGAASRSIVGLFSPAHKAAEFFGFHGLGSKLAAILGLLFFVLVEAIVGGRFQLVIAGSGLFFLGGLLGLLFVNEHEGRVAAVDATREHERKYHDFRGHVGALESREEA